MMNFPNFSQTIGISNEYDYINQIDDPIYKILLISDSHGLNVNRILYAHEKVDFAFHMGDSQLPSDHPDMQIFTAKVRGNCDLHSDFPIDSINEIEGLRLFITHGDHHHINFDQQEIIAAAKNAACQIAIHGHTHVVKVEVQDHILVINPGSLRQSRCSYPESYMILTIDDHNLFIELKSAQTSQILEEWQFEKSAIFGA